MAIPEPGVMVDRLRATAPNLSVGVLTANLLALGADLRLLEEAGVLLAHFDVMDGGFCPMMTVGPPFIKAVQTPMLKDVHLMIEQPLSKLDAYVAAGADMVTVHVESSGHPHRVLQALGSMANVNDPARPLLRGVALNPGTPVATVAPLLDELDAVFLLAVNPGWGGQEFIPSTASRLEELRRLIGARRILAGLDGGITLRNLPAVAAMGADIVVSGSAIFDGKTPAENLRRALAAVTRARVA